MRALTGPQFAAYAREQVAAAERILAGHTAADQGFCSCGRFLPCTIAQSCRRRRDHYTGCLALLEQTVPLPLIRPAGGRYPVAPRRRARRLRLLTWLFGGAR